MTRVVGGVARGRRLAVPPGRGTRPTSDRAREGLFSTLQTLTGSLDGLRVLDLYAGSGAVGLEALSRGAAQVLLVESDRRAAATVRRNVEAVGLPGAEVSTVPVERLVAAPSPRPPFDLAFLDPPYDVSDADVAGVLEALLQGGWLAPGAVVVVERATRGGPFAWPPGLAPRAGPRARARYGEATLWYGRAAGGERE